MDPEKDRRRAARLPAHIQLLYSVGREDRSGTLVELSRTGARIEPFEWGSPPIDARVLLCILTGVRDQQIEIEARVARHTENGFAVEFVNGASVEVLELLDSLRAG